MPQCPSKSSAQNAQLLDYVAGRLDSRQAAALAAHIRLCKACGEFVADQSATWNLLDDWTSDPAPSSFNREVYARIDQAGPEPIHSRIARLFTNWIPRPALTIPFATMLLLGSFYLDRPAAKQQEVSETAVAQAVTTNDADQINSALDDLQLLHQLDLVKDEAPDASRSM